MEEDIIFFLVITQRGLRKGGKQVTMFSPFYSPILKIIEY
jgi:hypothetical protein